MKLILIIMMFNVTRKWMQMVVRTYVMTAIMIRNGGYDDDDGHEGGDDGNGDGDGGDDDVNGDDDDDDIMIMLMMFCMCQSHQSSLSSYGT